MKPDYLSRTDVETRAEQVLSDYGRQKGRAVGIPIPIERIIDQLLDLPVLWESIPMDNGRIVVSKLVQPAPNIPARIVLNEDLRHTKFHEFPGLERTALAHEAGHAVFHLERGRVHQLGLGLSLAGERAPFVSEVEGLTRADCLAEALAARGPVDDAWWREWQAHTFMRFVLMPRRLLLPLLEGDGFLRWHGRGGLYDLRDRLGVTISALTVHLAKLGIAQVDRRGVIHDVRPLARGQRALSA